VTGIVPVDPERTSPVESTRASNLAPLEPVKRYRTLGTGAPDASSARAVSRRLSWATIVGLAGETSIRAIGEAGRRRRVESCAVAGT
jgi:hypothetical protein